MIAETSRAGRVALTAISRRSIPHKSFHTSSRRCKESKEEENQSNASSSSQESSAKAAKKGSIAEADERIRQMLLDRDGGPASVPTREGKWDQDMGRETARQMFRVLDQTRQNNPGTDTAKGEGESKHWNRRNY
ncbi:uncharacterized protein FA14DRAFT_190092 [Meira miltonrushii]|uniref:Uncharacterized protein n=1 Tax=Meira miltonrushii TaxID=1280837 RepID=A0A316VEY0_9BASI|nr:uncharacterized protein FA14DRAFT_190092 [Meira miltonrushii]PWN36187.1 hypothetical protein FA14DRAFT_190092 [Meira miltonrushii]